MYIHINMNNISIESITAQFQISASPQVTRNRHCSWDVGM